MNASANGSDRVKRVAPGTPATVGDCSKFANDSLGHSPTNSSRRNVTSADVNALARLLNARQRACLADVARLGIATARHLERLHYASTEAGRRLARLELSSLCDWRVLQRLSRRVGGVRGGSRGYIYALGVAGQRLAFPGRRRYRAPWTPQPSYLRHALDVAETYVGLREAENAGTIHLAVYDAEPACWRSFTGPGGTRVTLKPDAYVVTQHETFEDRWFIEVDRGTEDGPRVQRKLKTYLAYWRCGREQEHEGVFPLTCWIAPTDKRARFLLEVVRRLSDADQRLFVVTTKDDAISLITGNEPTTRKEVNP
ncbi:MAG: replication-relaxation family protein [Acidobacteriota bacterium]|nr:replication-relaxation family protein [Acidobacteriota bacterium]MDE3146818.1 replication-relaxation family protein [Acidobacteriota bacterium]